MVKAGTIISFVIEIYSCNHSSSDYIYHRHRILISLDIQRANNSIAFNISRHGAKIGSAKQYYLAQNSTEQVEDIF